MLAVAYFGGLKMIFQSAKMAKAPRWLPEGIPEPPNAPMAQNMASEPVLRATAQAGYAKR